MRKKQFLAFMLTGSLVLGMMPTAVFAEEAVDMGAGAVSVEAPAEPVAESQPVVASEPVAASETTVVSEPVVEDTPVAPAAETTPAAEVSAETPVVETPTEAPVQVPTEAPTETPQDPTQAPTEAPQDPTQAPTEAPQDPTQAPTEAPQDPTQAPTEAPQDPTQAPTETPQDPTQTPTETPQDPTQTPTETPDFSAPTPGSDVIIIDYSQNATLNTDGTGTDSDNKELIPIAIGDKSYESLEAAILEIPETTDASNPVFTEIVISEEILYLDKTVNIPANKYVSIVAGIEDVTIARKEGFTGDMFTVSGGALSFGGEELAEDGSTLARSLNIDGAVTGENIAEVGSLVYVDEGILGISENAYLANNNATKNGGAVRNDKEGTVFLMGGMVCDNSTDALGGGIYSEGMIGVQADPIVIDNVDANNLPSNIVLSGENGVVLITDILEADMADLNLQVLNPKDGTQVVFLAEDEKLAETTIADMLPMFTYEGIGFDINEEGKLIVEQNAGEDENPDDGTGDEGENPDDGTGDGSEEPDVGTGVEVPVTDSKVTGLADSMYFYPEGVIANNPYTYYTFKVEGAGMDKSAEEALDGDTRWNPAYWSYSENPSDTEKYTTWTLGTKSGISEAGTYTFYVFFNEEVFDSEKNDWVATGETDYISHTYNSLKLFELKGVSYTWIDQTTASVTFRTNKPAKYFVDWVERTTANQQQPNHRDESVYVEMSADTNLTITLRDLDADKPINVYAYAIDNNGGIKRGILFELDENKRPQTSTREPYIPSVTESKVTGLENALEFYPNTFYPFTVVGAGTNNTEPIAGDVKWVPVYWSTSSNPSSSQKHTAWKIGAAAGISAEATYNLYVFYQKYTHNGSQWVATDTISPVAYQFKSAKIEITQTPTPSAGSDGYNGGYYDEDGNYVPYDDTSDPSYYEDDTDDTGAESTIKNAVDTSDETPVGNMFAMLAASLMAGLYVVFRRRKNSN